MMTSFDNKPYNFSMFLNCPVEHTTQQTYEHLEAYLARLEEEKLKIESFKRELPICMQLLTDAMMRLRQELQSHSTKQSEIPIIQFIPMKNATGSDSVAGKYKDRTKWMTFAREMDMNPKEIINFDEETISCMKSDNNSVESRGNDLVAEKESKNTSQRKARRCWSPDLHSRFVDALRTLGCAQATPKQIRELMKVEGLTNDEVKSHLQKYRLHTRASPSQQDAGGPQLVVLGSIWVPPAGHALNGSTCSRFSY